MKASAIIVNTDIDRDLDIYDNDFTFYERNEEEKEQIFLNPLLYYKYYSNKYKHLSVVVKHLMCVTGTSVPFECLFSHVGLMSITIKRENMID